MPDRPSRRAEIDHVRRPRHSRRDARRRNRRARPAGRRRDHRRGDLRHRRRARRARGSSTPAGHVVTPGLRRHPHPLRRPGVLGPGAHPVVLARRHERRRRQLRLLDRTGAGPSTASCSSARCSTSRTCRPTRCSRACPWDDFETFPQYFDAIEQRGTLLNYACYVGHTAVRLYVMGERRLRARGDRRRDPRHAAGRSPRRWRRARPASRRRRRPTHNGDRVARCRRRHRRPRRS